MVFRTLALVSLVACTADTFGGGDAGAEAGDDAASDAASDASDAGVPPSCAPNPTQCAGNSCSADQECCVTSAQVQCRSVGNTCGGEMLGCLTPNDCATFGDGGSPLCCLTSVIVTSGCPRIVGTGNSQCVPSGACGTTGGTRLCQNDSDCPKQSCVAARFANSTSFSFGICQ